MEQVNTAMSNFWHLSDDDYLGLTPQEFLDTFRQCRYCGRIPVAWKPEAHKETRSVAPKVSGSGVISP